MSSHRKMNSYRRSGRLILREALKYSRGQLFSREQQCRAAIPYTIRRPVPATSVLAANTQSGDLRSFDGSLASGVNGTKRGRLREQYLVIGDALLQGEPMLSRLLGVREFSRSEDIWIKGSRLNRFRVAVSFVETEILQSYLDDLVDLSIGDECLNIRQTAIERSLPFILLIAFLFMVGSGDAVSGHNELISHIAGVAVSARPIAVVLGAAFAALCFILAIRSGHSRRLSFARIVSIEIARRRGGSQIVGERNFRERLAAQGLLSGGLVSEWCGGPGDAVAA